VTSSRNSAFAGVAAGELVLLGSEFFSACGIGAYLKLGGLFMS